MKVDQKSTRIAKFLSQKCSRQRMKFFPLITTSLTLSAGIMNASTCTNTSSASNNQPAFCVKNAVASASALGVNYSLYLINFNSLNKRMGELRNNANTHGVWTRIFTGQLSADYAIQTKSIYTTLQIGYDYATGSKGVNNYWGIALSYANASTDSKEKSNIDESTKALNKNMSHAIELAVYNAHIEDEGWFNSNILKFSYIISNIEIKERNSSYKSNNFALNISEEFGYRFALGKNKEWNIDPQAEVGVGYFSQTEFTQILEGANLQGIQNKILTLRAKVGTNWIYDFKNFTENRPIKASLYVGTYYAYDYIYGGEITLKANLGKTTSLQTLSPTGRFILNIGTNLIVKDNTRIYFDFERSFGGKINIDYQVNLGVRYSFGEGNYTPVIQKANAREDFAPLKLEIEEIQPEEPEPIKPIEILQPIQPVQPTELIQPVEPTLEEVIEEPRIEEQIVSQIKFQKTLQVMKVEKLVNSLNTVSAKIFSNSFLKNSIDNLLTSLRYLQFFSVIPNGNSQKDKDQK